jgi:hypothetical protein
MPSSWHLLHANETYDLKRSQLSQCGVCAAGRWPLAERMTQRSHLFRAAESITSSLKGYSLKV